MQMIEPNSQKDQMDEKQRKRRRSERLILITTITLIIITFVAVTIWIVISQGINQNTLAILGTLAGVASVVIALLSLMVNYLLQLRNDPPAPVKQSIEPGVRRASAAETESPLEAMVIGNETTLWNVPYERNQSFSDRDKELKHLDEVFIDGKTGLTIPQPVSGLGGIGKTQLAVEYAYRHRDKYKAILWASADSRETLVSDYVKIATLLKFPKKYTENQTHAVNAVKYWLEHNDNWLLIFDNADNPTIVKEFQPSLSSKGHILLTTQMQSIGRMAQSIGIEGMEIVEGALFLLRRVNIIDRNATLESASKEDRIEAQKISDILGGFPLALDQAGAYIEETSCSLSDYLDRYQKRQSRLLNRRGNDPSDHPKPVSITLSLSFEKVEQANRAAADLLKYLAFLHRDAIPEEIISEGAPELGQLLQTAAADPFELDEVIGILRKFSLVHRDARTKTLSIHRLVQDVLKNGMNEETQQCWAERAVRAVNRAFPDVDFALWPRCERCLTHAQICAAHIEQWQMTFIEAARLLEQTANYLLVRSQYKQAEPFYWQAQTIYEQNLGPEHPKLAEIFKDLGWLHYKRAEYMQAENLYTQAQAIREKVLGPEHPDVADILNKRGLVYYNLGKFPQAEQFYKQARDIDEKALGIENIKTGDILNNLGWLYYNQARYPEAGALYQRALAIREKALGKEHPDVAETLNGQAMLARSLCNYGQAEKLFKRALEIRERALGKDHPDVAITLNDLAWLYRTRGRYAEAEQTYQRAAEIRTKALGPEHRHLATSLNDFALLYMEQGKYQKAEPLLQRALAIREQTVGQDHHRLAATLNNLGWLYYNLGKYPQAEEHHRRALKIREQALGLERPQPYIAQSLNGLGEVSRVLGRYHQAEEYHKRALEIREQVFEPEHRHVAMSLNNTARLYVDQGRYAEAEQLYQRALQIWERVLGPRHPNMAQSLSGLAEVRSCQGNYPQAEELYQRALAIYEESMGLDHPYVAISLNGLGRLYVSMKSYAKAEELLIRALSIRERVLGLEHPDVAATLHNQALLRYNQGEYVQAEEIFKRALGIDEKILGPDHPYVATILVDLAALLRNTNRVAEAVELEKRSESILCAHARENS